MRMHANSRPVISSQVSLHEHLPQRLARHLCAPFKKPIAAYNRHAFNRIVAAWQEAGSPPLILDSGCGIGLSTLHLARLFPDAFVVGVDQSEDRLARHIPWEGELPPNCLRVRADVVDIWRLMRQAQIRLSRHYLFYPNPWPKKNHLGRRWHGHPVFPDMVALGGYVECRSNWHIYVEECAVALKQVSGTPVHVEAFLPGMEREEGNPAAPLYMTPFEQKYALSGHILWRCRVSLDSAALATPPRSAA